MKNKKLDHLQQTAEPGVFSPWQEVSIEVYDFSDLGISVAVNDEYTGLIYNDEVTDSYKIGQKLQAYIKQVRVDGKIDITLLPKPTTSVFTTTDKILEHLQNNGGTSSFHDKSSPEEIKREFQVSKKLFKQAIGKLYKQGKITLVEGGIELVQ